MRTLYQQITNDQDEKIIRMICDIAKSEPVKNKILSLSKEQAKLLEDNADFVRSLRNLMVEEIGNHCLLKSYWEEQVDSDYRYIGYQAPTALMQQVNDLNKYFPGIGNAGQDYLKKIEEGKIKLRKDSEGLFVVPNPFKNERIFGKAYADKVNTVLAKIKETSNGNFENFYDGEINERNLRMSDRTERFFRIVAEEQGDPNLLIVGAQFGIKFGGKSVRRALYLMSETADEAGLGSFCIGCMLLTHKDRLNHKNDLWINCAGDEYDNSSSADRFNRVPLFALEKGAIKCNMVLARIAVGRSGAVSGFLPEN